MDFAWQLCTCLHSLIDLVCGNSSASHPCLHCRTSVLPSYYALHPSEGLMQAFILSSLLAPAKLININAMTAGNGNLISSTQAHSKGINAVSILPSAQGPMALSAGKDHSIRLWSTPALEATESGDSQQGASCVAVYKGHTDAVEDVAASPSGSAFCSGAWDGHVHIWRTGAAYMPYAEEL